MRLISPPPMRLLRIVALAALASVVAVSQAPAQAKPLPPELPTTWVKPPGDELEHTAAGFAKVLCSAIFITGRDLRTSAAEDGYFVSSMEERRQVTDTVVNRATQTVKVKLPNGVWRSARRFGDQGCVTLPRGKDSVEFRPERVVSRLNPTKTPWPMGDIVAKEPLPKEIDAAKLAAAVDSAFSPAEGLTAAFVVVYQGKIIAERYQQGLDYTTRTALHRAAGPWLRSQEWLSRPSLRLYRRDRRTAVRHHASSAVAAEHGGPLSQYRSAHARVPRASGGYRETRGPTSVPAETPVRQDRRESYDARD